MHPGYCHTLREAEIFVSVVAQSWGYTSACLVGMTCWIIPVQVLVPNEQVVSVLRFFLFGNHPLNLLGGHRWSCDIADAVLAPHYTRRSGDGGGCTNGAVTPATKLGWPSTTENVGSRPLNLPHGPIPAEYASYSALRDSCGCGPPNDLVRSIRTKGVADLVNMLLQDVTRLDETVLTDDRSMFPLKDSPAAATKVNVFLRDALEDMRVAAPDAFSAFIRVGGELSGAYNDEATGWAMWFAGYWSVDPVTAIALLLKWNDQPALKDLNLLIKGLGLNKHRAGSMGCELNVLRGRGCEVPHAWDDIQGRVDKAVFASSKGVTFSGGELSSALRQVINEELGCAPQWPDRDQYWSRRWLTTKAGAHSQYFTKVMGGRIHLPERPTRREFAENTRENIIAKGYPRVDAGLSWKLEHGKTRAIYSCDSRSYFTFDYLLSPIEKAWGNRTVLLDPGRFPQSLLYQRLALARSSHFYMADFDDFNSQHTLGAMALAIEIATEGAPSDVRAWAIKSFFNTHFHWSQGGGCLQERQSVGTLPSGHRATTFINTLLNAAYCRIVSGPSYCRARWLHCGDDVIATAPGPVVDSLAQCFRDSSVRMNSNKQSIGSETGEFLRVAFDSSGAVGYFARAVASTVSGNWVSEVELDRRSCAETLCRLSWTLWARSARPEPSRMLASTFRRRVPEMAGYVKDLIDGTVSLDGSPVAAGTQNPVNILRLEGGGWRKQNLSKHFESYATQDFLDNHVDQ
eukprot:417100_1